MDEQWLQLMARVALSEELGNGAMMRAVGMGLLEGEKDVEGAETGAGRRMSWLRLEEMRRRPL